MNGLRIRMAEVNKAKDAMALESSKNEEAK